MPVIHVHLREGFQDDTAIVRVGDRIVRHERLKTRMQIGRAAFFDLDVSPGPVDLDVQVPTRGLERKVALEVPAQGELYVGVSIENGSSLACTVSEQPFHYA